MNLFLIEDQLHFLLEPNDDRQVVENVPYSVYLRTPNKVPHYTRNLFVDEVMSFISMDRLEQYKWADGRCVFEIRVKVRQQPASLSQETSTKRLKFEEIGKALEGDIANGKFRLTVDKLIKNSSRTPFFQLDSVKLQLTVYKYSRNGGSNLLRVQLGHKSSRDRSLTMECKLILNPSVNGSQHQLNSHNTEILKKVDRPKIHTNTTSIDMVAWDGVLASLNPTIPNDSFVLEIQIKIGKNETVRLECPICTDSLIGKPLSSTQCGHIWKKTQFVRHVISFIFSNAYIQFIYHE